MSEQDTHTITELVKQNDGTNVLMHDFRPDSREPIRNIKSYWQSLRNGHVVPKRSEVNPREIQNDLHNAFILERISTGIARFRVSGQVVNNIIGMDARGMLVTSLLAVEDRRDFADRLEELFQEPSVLDIALTDSSHSQEANAHLSLLPLRSDLGDVSRALGVITFGGSRTGQKTALHISHVSKTQLLRDTDPIEHPLKPSTDISPDTGLIARQNLGKRRAAPPDAKRARRSDPDQTDMKQPQRTQRDRMDRETRDRIAHHRRQMFYVIRGGAEQ